MINKPRLDDLKKFAGNKYILCTAVSKREKELNKMQQRGEVELNKKAISAAAEQLYNDEIEIEIEK